MPIKLYKRKKDPSKNILIRSREDWLRCAPPKREIHIAKGHSAEELINRWTPGRGSPTVPDELQALLDCHELTAHTTLTHGFAECETGLPPNPGHGPRNHDLLLFGKNTAGEIVVGVEAKANEVFDLMLNEKLRRIIKNDRTGLPKRIDWLLRELFACQFDTDAFHLRVSATLSQGTKWEFSDLFSDGQSARPELAALRYQLFAGVAGTMLEAGDVSASAAVFVVYEFRTSQTKDRKLASNAADFQAFCQMFQSIKNIAIEHGKLYGPITLPNGGTSCKRLPQIPLLIGKIRVNLRGDDA